MHVLAAIVEPGALTAYRAPSSAFVEADYTPAANGFPPLLILDGASGKHAIPVQPAGAKPWSALLYAQDLSLVHELSPPVVVAVHNGSLVLRPVDGEQVRLRILGEEEQHNAPAKPTVSAPVAAMLASSRTKGRLQYGVSMKRVYIRTPTGEMVVTIDQVIEELVSLYESLYATGTS